MKAALSFVSLLSLVAIAASSTLPSGGKVLSCDADARVLVDTSTVTVDGHELTVSTKACSANMVTSRSFEKRQIALCGLTAELECVTGVAGPIIADCVNLQALLPSFIATQPEFFELAPQTLRSVTFGTCEYAWINNNPLGGVFLEGCWPDVERFGANLTPDCIEIGEPAGIAFPPVAVLNEAWLFEFVCCLCETCSTNSDPNIEFSWFKLLLSLTDAGDYLEQFSVS
ncbi:hypothetical protein GGX14DRAFT_399057 [Mycena pura]|uniref:Uncharacterized protein n=1 Tax=Mycena pura TaxID=153505 RepID=A0AAD6V8W1_9AGAR|nr:hypothetical protein GGX14DRAFT_399057 [Mycena pura]